MQEREKTEEEKREKLPESVWQKTMAAALVAALLGLCALGFALPLRPHYSDAEKRALRTLPVMRIEGLWSGQYFRDLTSWFSDSFPFRERLLDYGAKLMGLYGLKGEAVYISGEQEREEIPSAAAELAPTMALSGNADAAENAAETAVESEAELFETDAEGNLLLPKAADTDIAVSGEKAGNIYVADSRAYELFYFSQKNVTAYASMLNTVKSLLPEVKVYDMIVPNSYGVQLDPAVQAKLASSGMDTAIDFTYSLMHPDIHRISVFSALFMHRDEYIYFHTDHHWTQLGAYYAYVEFCREKGISPHALSEFQKAEYDGFYGTFYFSTNRAEALRQNPDRIEAWIPMGTNDMRYRNKDGAELQGHVVNDGSAMLAGNRYNTFLLGDNPYTEIENPNIQDGSSILLVKESYGNAFAPFLVDHYQHVYVVDYRYYGGKLTDFIREHQVGEVLFLNNIMALGQKTSGEMLALFG